MSRIILGREVDAISAQNAVFLDPIPPDREHERSELPGTFINGTNRCGSIVVPDLGIYPCKLFSDLPTNPFNEGVPEEPSRRSPKSDAAKVSVSTVERLDFYTLLTANVVPFA